MKARMQKGVEFVYELCNRLAARGALTDQDAQTLATAFKESSAASFEDFLLEEGMVTKEALLEVLSDYYQVPALDVIGVFFDHHMVCMFPKDVMLRHGFIPYERDGDVLIVVASWQSNPELPEIIGSFVSYDVTFMVGLYRDINDMVKEFYDESLATVEIQLFEDTQDTHVQQPIDDVLDSEE